MSEITAIERLDGRTNLARQVKETLAGWADDFRGVPLTGDILIYARRAAILIAWIESAEREWINDAKPLPASYPAMLTRLESLLAKLDRYRRFQGLAA
ncbi:hypothetical protein [Mesorhizobium denitrificans]|uniref:Uncharacterized protein n=1 Tax=Mesorhizobium denitrificans TaxID=2294114 RepID=A0A371XF41_9HYPH|nr:hypothetical protein [Mesorhizobium denitrificans]RFC67850.1 hypothetical protein DY251_09715 [Mesorhizobium denitrificans]